MAKAIRWTPEQLRDYNGRGRRASALPVVEKPQEFEDLVAKHRERTRITREELLDYETPNGELARQFAMRGIVYTREFEFHPTRNWRFDFYFPHEHDKLALEVNGGIFVEGRHTQGAALLKEYEKLSEAAILGYRVLMIEPGWIRNGRALEFVLRALDERNGARSWRAGLEGGSSGAPPISSSV